MQTHRLKCIHTVIVTTTAISWEKHENAYCLGKLSTTVYHSFSNATSACEQYGPSVCTGVYAIKCGMNKHYLCKAYFDYAPGNVYAPGVCLYTST